MATQITPSNLVYILHYFCEAFTWPLAWIWTGLRLAPAGNINDMKLKPGFLVLFSDMACTFIGLTYLTHVINYITSLLSSRRFTIQFGLSTIFLHLKGCAFIQAMWLVTFIHLIMSQCCVILVSTSYVFNSILVDVPVLVCKPTL